MDERIPTISRRARRGQTLERMLAHRRWFAHAEPFPHLTAREVFVAPVYAALERHFQAVLARGFGAPDDATRFHRSASGYDAYMYTLPPGLHGPLRLFVSRAWHDLLASLTGVQATGDINSGLHHHVTGSANGWIHNDLNPGWFVEDREPNGLNLIRPARCSYANGICSRPGETARCTVRATAMLFFLNNAPWHRGDGGETGLYRQASDAVDAPCVAVPPINNSLLVFECTPYSYHSFISNRRHVRNSVILWLHRPWHEAAQRWGERAIVRWPAHAADQ